MLYHFFFYKILVFMHRKNGKNTQIKKVYKLFFWEKARIAQVVHIRYFILKMSKILHRVRFIVSIYFPWSLILLRLFYADFVRFILSTLNGVFYRHCTVYFTDIVRFTLLTLYGLFYRHCTVQFTDIVRCI